MKYLKPQLGVSESADFEQNTWSFRMPEPYKASAGLFYIVDSRMFAEIMAVLSTANQQNMSQDLIEEIEKQSQLHAG